MPVPVQNVSAFAEAELWFIYQQLTEINTNTSGGGGGLSQTELFEVFNGTNPEGKALSLFDGDDGLAKIVTICKQYLNSIDGTTQSIDSNVESINTKVATATNQTTANASLSSIDTKLTNVATSTLQTTGNNSLSSIDTKLSSQATATNQTTANASLSSIDTKLTNNATSTLQTTGNSSLSNIDSNTGSLRTPVIISTSGSGTIAPQIHNVSFYNSGAATGTITVNGTTINLPTGVSVNYNAGGNNNRYAVNIFSYNATGTTFLISYTQ